MLPSIRWSFYQLPTLTTPSLGWAGKPSLKLLDCSDRTRTVDSVDMHITSYRDWQLFGVVLLVGVVGHAYNVMVIGTGWHHLRWHSLVLPSQNLESWKKIIWPCLVSTPKDFPFLVSSDLELVRLPGGWGSSIGISENVCSESSISIRTALSISRVTYDKDKEKTWP